MPRGKKARKPEDEKSIKKDESGNSSGDLVLDEAPKKETKPKTKHGKKPAEPISEVHQIPETTSESIESFIKSHQDSSDLSQSLYTLFQNSSNPRLLLNAAVSVIFQIVESDPTRFSWGKALIQKLSSEHMEPKPRLREAHFFPNPDSEQNVIDHLLSAKKKLLICVFALTNDNMANAIRKAKANGVDIRLIFDDEMMRQPGSDVRALHDEGYPVRVDLDPKAHMHHKFVVIDDKILITGSYNWTKQAATKNRENVVIVEDKQFAEMYTKEFNKLWEEFAGSVDQHLGGELKEKKGE